jgi:hypothetical protein
LNLSELWSCLRSLPAIAMKSGEEVAKPLC